MGRVRDYIPALRYGHKIYPEDMIQMFSPLSSGKVIYVDGDKSSGGSGTTWDDAYTSIQTAVTAASAGDVILVAERTITALSTDPISYAETIIIPNTKPHLSIIGVSRGLTQGGLPQIKIGSGTTAMITVRAPGCLIANLGINGASSTGGGILLDDDGGTSKVAFGTTIIGCHFKNCKAHATNGTLGGGIYTSSAGGAWQTRIIGNVFYKNVGGIVVVGTGTSVPQDWIIENNVFGSSAEGASSETDVDIYVGGSGVKGLLIRNNDFLTPDVPTLASGSVGRYISLATGTVGMVSGNSFSCLVNPAATEVTFGATGTAGIIPTTVRLANNWGETSSTTERCWVNRV
jgi:hypothetical protein